MMTDEDEMLCVEEAEIHLLAESPSLKLLLITHLAGFYFSLPGDDIIS